MSKKRKKRSDWLSKAGLAGQEINTHLSELGIEQASAMLSEGFCPVCKGRGVESPPFEPPEDERPASVVVNCEKCKLRWRSGPNPMNEMDWIEYTQATKHLTLAMCLNAPPEPEEDHDDWDWED